MSESGTGLELVSLRLFLLPSVLRDFQEHSLAVSVRPIMELDVMECLQFQVAEIEALDAAYPQCVRLSPLEHRALQVARALCGLPKDSGTESFILLPVGPASFSGDSEHQDSQDLARSCEDYEAPQGQQPNSQHSFQPVDDLTHVCSSGPGKEGNDDVTHVVGTRSGQNGSNGNGGSSSPAGPAGGLQGVQELSGACLLPDVQVGGAPVWLRFQLPFLYPQQAAQLCVDCAASRSMYDALAACASAVTRREAETGTCCLLLAMQELKECIEQLAAAEQPALASDDASQAEIATQPRTSVTVVRQLIWFHHIKSLTKRKTIVSDARELQLGGASKPGFPGVVVVEGEAGHVQEFTARVRALSWQAMQVRGTEEQEVTSPPDSTGIALDQLAQQARRLPLPFIELPETGMSELGAMCKEAGLDSLFLTALKL